MCTILLPLGVNPIAVNKYIIYINKPIQVAARSTAWVCARSLAGIVGSNPAGSMDVCRECCVLYGYRRLRRADYLSRGVVSSVMCLSVIAEPREGGDLGLLGPSSNEKDIISM
jgi:hypothetical protein